MCNLVANAGVAFYIRYGRPMATPRAASNGHTESQMVVVTPTYAPDLELFSDLHQSVLRCFPADVPHVAVVPETDLRLFRRFEGPRCRVIGVRDVLPRSVFALPFLRYHNAALWMNVRRPVPPLRGWIVQQLVKLSVASQMSERIIVTVDSDLVFVRPVTVATFAPNEQARLYRLDEGVGDSLPRHLRWHAVAHELLGLQPAPPPPLPDYVAPLATFDRDVLNRMLRRVEQATGRRWLEAVGKELYFSECTLYGVYADYVERAKNLTPTAESLCHSYWDPVIGEHVPLTAEQATGWLSSVGPHDVAYMISAKTRTPLEVRRAAHASVFPS
jgi:hypothetical protein